MQSVQKITCLVWRGEDFWIIKIPAIDSITQAKRISQIAPMAFDLYECQTDQIVDINRFEFRFLCEDSQLKFDECLRTDDRAQVAIATWREKAEQVLADYLQRQKTHILPSH